MVHFHNHCTLVVCDECKPVYIENLANGYGSRQRKKNTNTAAIIEHTHIGRGDFKEEEEKKKKKRGNKDCPYIRSFFIERMVQNDVDHERETSNNRIVPCSFVVVVVGGSLSRRRRRAAGHTRTNRT